MFVPGKHYKPSPMFAGKAWAYLSEASFRCSTLGVGPWPYLQRLDKSGKACKEQTLWLIIKIQKLQL